MKTFTIVDSTTQSKISFQTEATTVGELLAELTAHHISYAGKSLYEGLTKSEFSVKNTEGLLPHDVPYKGNVTNDLVFMLTTEKKKVASGADRKEIMAEIKSLGLADRVKEVYGRNYTQVSTDNLLAILNANCEACEESKPEVKDTVEDTVENVQEKAKKDLANLTAAALADELVAFIRNLIARGLISLDSLKEEESADELDSDEPKAVSAYTDSEVKDMFAFVNRK